MPTLADTIIIDRTTATVTIDGQEFPYLITHVAVADMGMNRSLATVSVDIPADRLEIINPEGKPA